VVDHFGLIGPNLPWDINGTNSVDLNDALDLLSCAFPS
jgi:hypothetical protein